MVRLALLFPLLALGCADYSALDAEREAAPDDWDGAAEDDDETDAGDVGDDERPYWQVGGTLVTLGGEVLREATELEIGVYVGTQLDCVATPIVAAVTRVDADPEEDPPMVALWQVSLDVTPVDGCAWTGPATFDLGLGPMEPDLEPAAARADIDVNELSLYGLYVAVDGPLVAFGVAGTEAQFAGTVEAVDAAPLPDGAYTLRGLHVLPR